MGLYFRKRVKIFPGVHLNISKTGTSWSVGPRGASVNVGKKGVYVNSGIPGTGIYSRTKISGGSSNYDRDKHYSSKREDCLCSRPTATCNRISVFLLSV